MAAPPGDSPPAPPDAAGLHEAALGYLARYAATRASLLRVLERRIDRWARQAHAAGQERDAIAAATDAAGRAAREVVARLAAAGAVNDAAFAESRARSLVRAGRSRSAITAALRAKGVAAETLREALPGDDADADLAAALVLARRRRLGPFGAADMGDPVQRRRALAIFARAGFAQAIAVRALDTDLEEAEALVIRLRR
jgi:regulatory protein